MGQYYDVISGTDYTSTPRVITITVPSAGDHFIEIGYSKDHIASNGQDCAWFEIVDVSETVGVIDEEAKTVSVIVPYGTNLGSLAPTITVSPDAAVSPASGEAQDFTSPVTYTVTAENGTTASYTVTVTAPNNAKAITGFSFADPAVTGVIDETNRAISVTVPYGTSLSSLIPTITVSPDAAVSPASGEARDFTNPVIYTVTAENGDMANYTITVSKKGQGAITPEKPRDQNAQILVDGTPAAGPLTLTQAETKTLSTTAVNPSWKIDGNGAVGGTSFVLNGSRYAVGRHIISLRVVINGVRYSTELKFTVIE
jgi:hypothetical protein